MLRSRNTMLFAGAVVAMAFGGASIAQPSTDQMNEANNPLTPKITINFQDYWTPRLYGTDDDTNSFLLRGVVPHKVGGMPQVLRGTLPITTAPSASGNVTGTGDLNLFDLFLFKRGNVELGIGPQLTAPTASKDETGTGKWQAGLAGVVIAPQKWGLLGGLITWQHSFAGDSDRATQNNLSAQPIVLYNLPEGWYLRSSGVWNFDLARNHYSIPVGAGFGKVWVLGDGTTVNLFAEPQWTVAHDGGGQPKFQVFAGLNLQFPIGK